jgi:hypothetical protein
MDLDNVGMAQLGDGSRFAFEAIERIGVFFVQIAEDLDCDLAAQGVCLNRPRRSPRQPEIDLHSEPFPTGHI